MIEERVRTDRIKGKGEVVTAPELHSYLGRVFYNRRNKMDPFWNSILVAGFEDGKAYVLAPVLVLLLLSLPVAVFLLLLLLCGGGWGLGKGDGVCAAGVLLLFRLLFAANTHCPLSHSVCGPALICCVQPRCFDPHPSILSRACALSLCLIPVPCALCRSLGIVDLIGTTYTEDFLATGFGNHLAVPLMRERWSPDMSEEEARLLLEDCMRVLWYRDCRASCKVPRCPQAG
jgi:hypothetical protein